MAQRLPIFRTRAQERILAHLFVSDGGPFSLTQLSEQTRIPLSTVHREVALLDRAGLVLSQRIGNARLVTPNRDSPYHDDLSSILLKAFGPATVLASLLAGAPGLDSAHIFGSWARRYHGEVGPGPNDVDLLVVGDVDPPTVYKLARDAEEMLGIEVNPVVLSQAEWSDPKGLARRIKAEPLVELAIHQ